MGVRKKRHNDPKRVRKWETWGIFRVNLVLPDAIFLRLVHLKVCTPNVYLSS